MCYHHVLSPRPGSSVAENPCVGGSIPPQATKNTICRCPAQHSMECKFVLTPPTPLKPSQFELANLASNVCPALFSLGSIKTSTGCIAAASPIFWQASISVSASDHKVDAAALFIESAALQIFVQAPNRVKMYIFNTSMQLRRCTHALTGIATLLGDKSRQKQKLSSWTIETI